MINSKEKESNSSNNNQSKPKTYKMIKLIGEGAFGKAYLVECIADRRLCVIKTINVDNMTEQERKETQLEARILEKLDHPNIIRFREVFMALKPRFTLNIVTDFADGGDLQMKIKSQKGKLFNENQILDWFTQICLALKHIHDKKILHRDLKSQNIFLTENGIIKLGDFGIAKCLECTWEKAMTVVGTPYYLSPEIVNNKPYSFKSDIWSLGVLLYELTALKMPFDATSLPMLSLKIIRGNYNPLPITTSRELRNLVSMLLIVDFNKRPTINEILRLPIIKSRIKTFLNEFEYNMEFSHTIIHNYNVLKDKDNRSNLHRNSSNSDNNVNSSNSSNNNNYNGQEVKKNVPINISNPNIIFNNNGNKNVIPNLVVNTKPQVVDINLKRKESDNKEIAEAMKKVEAKKKNLTPLKEIKHEAKKPAVNIKENNYNQNNNQIINHMNKEINIVHTNNINNINNNQNSYNNAKNSIESENNVLKEIMRKARADMKNKPKEDVVWLGKEKENKEVVVKKKDEPHKFAKVVIKESKPNLSPNILDANSNNSLEEIKIKDKKKEEDLYNLNRMLTELAKMENDEENFETEFIDVNLKEDKDKDKDKEINLEYKASEELGEARDFNEIDSENSEFNNSNGLRKDTSNSDNDIYTDNTQIEELRIELEKSLGFEMFKKVYKIVEDKTDPFLIKCDFELLKEIIIEQLSGKSDKKVIDSAIDKIPEVFAIVVRERVNNLK